MHSRAFCLYKPGGAGRLCYKLSSTTFAIILNLYFQGISLQSAGQSVCRLALEYTDIHLREARHYDRGGLM